MLIGEFLVSGKWSVFNGSSAFGYISMVPFFNPEWPDDRKYVFTVIKIILNFLKWKLIVSFHGQNY